MAKYTQLQYQTLSAAYVQGVLSVKFGDKEVVYRSKEDMKAILQEMEADLGITKVANRRKFIQYTKGLQ